MTETRAEQEALAYLEAFGPRNPDAPAWLVELRREARDRLGQLGFPTMRDEEWKYTDPRLITETPFRAAGYDPTAISEERIAQLTSADPRAPRIVLINGHYSRELSRTETLPKGLTIGSLGDAIDSRTPPVAEHLGRRARFAESAFTALNTALIEEGAYIHVGRNAAIEAPIHVLHVSCSGEERTGSHPRTLIVAEEGSEATVVERYIGSGNYLTNAVTEVSLAQNAVLEHYRLQRESEGALHVSTLSIHQGRDSAATTHNISLGGHLVRNNVDVYLAGEGAEATLNGLTVISGRQHVDNHTRIDHAVPHCPSHELYKGVYDGESTGVFSGRIFVHPDAQKTDAKQTNQNLLLSPNATVNSKPQLEIYADDVRCTHGATIGQLDEEAIFYLRARGIGAEEARGMLTYAFASEMVERVRVPGLRAHLESALIGLRSFHVASEQAGSR